MTTTTASIVVSSVNNTSVQNHVITKRFPQTYRSRNDRIALVGLSMPYSWHNVTNAFVNTGGVNYVFNGTSYPVPYPEGSYNVDDLSNFLINAMELNGHYLVDDVGEKVFFISWTTNPIYYTVTTTITLIPSSLPTGWTNPMAIVLSGTTPQLEVLANNNWGALIGYSAGFYPTVPSATTVQFNSTIPPIISPITVVNVECNWIFSNRFDNYSATLSSFVPDQAFGSTLSINPPNLVYQPVSANDYPDISISFYDQSHRPLALVDRSQIQIVLQLETTL